MANSTEPRTGSTVCIRLVLADRHALFRGSARAILGSQPDFEVVAEAGSGFSAVSEVIRTRPDVAVIDAELKDCDGLKTIEIIRDHLPECSVFILADREDESGLLRLSAPGPKPISVRPSRLPNSRAPSARCIGGRSSFPPGMLRPLLTGLLETQRRRGEGDRVLPLKMPAQEIVALADDENEAPAAGSLISAGLGDIGAVEQT